MKFNNNDELSGNWLNDNIFNGIMKYSNGDMYEENWKNKKEKDMEK